MTEPPPLPPLNPSTASPTRPTALTVIAIVGIVFGLMGVICSPFGALPYMMEMPGPPNPVVEMVKESTWMFAYMMMSLVVGFIFGVILLVGSIGALQLKPWARPVLIGYAIASLVTTVISTVVTLIMFLPLLQNSGDPAVAGAGVGGMIGAGCGLCLGFAVQGAMLYILSRPDVKRAFGKE
jgi:hypothetical protein